MSTRGSEPELVLKRRTPFGVEPVSERLAFEKLHGDEVASIGLIDFMNGPDFRPVRQDKTLPEDKRQAAG